MNESIIREFHLTQKYLVVFTKTVKIASEILDVIFGTLWKHGLINSHILNQDESKIWSLYAFMPYQINCYKLSYHKQITFTALNSTNNLTLSNKKLYPEKLKNLQKCPLFIAASIIEPFVIIQTLANGTVVVDGIEMLIIEQTSKLLNFTIVHKRSSSGTGHGLIFDNGTATGNLGLVLNGEANITFGGNMVTNERAKHFSIGVLYYAQQRMVFAFKENDYQISFARFTAPFEFYIWLLIGMTLFVTTITILLTKKLNRRWRHFIIGGRKNRTPIQNMLAIVLGYPICNKFITNGKYLGTFGRTLAIHWIILWLIIRSSYQGALYNHLQAQIFTSPYDTFEKIQKSNCKVLSIPSTFSMCLTMFKPERYDQFIFNTIPVKKK